MVGSTLTSPKTPSDTTSILRDRISIVSVYSGRWAELQTQTFVDEKQHPELTELMTRNEQQSGKSLVQKVEVNVEEDWMKALIVRAFMGGIRKQRGEEDWGRYFLVRRGVDEEIREAIGMGNAKVGYVYLVDWLCRIRWAGSANADAEEKEGLRTGMRRLMEGWRKEREDEKKVGEAREAVLEAGK